MRIPNWKKRDEDDSIKNVIVRRAYWIKLFSGWYSNGLAGRTAYFPAQGYKWNDLKRFNSDLRKRQSNLDWPNAVAMLQGNYHKLKIFIHDHSEEDRYDGPVKGGSNAWTPGRWAEGAGPSHFRSAS